MMVSLSPNQRVGRTMSNLTCILSRLASLFARQSNHTRDRKLPYCALSFIFIISGCASTPTPQIVKVPVPQPCITADQLPKPPDAKNDAELTKMDDFDFVITLAADRLEYRRYANEAQAVLQACVK